MQAIARWTRLPETTFVFPPTQPGASYRIRMFSPRREVPFAGHPSVGTAHVVLEAGLASAARRPAGAGRHRRHCCRCASTAKARTRTIAVRTPRARVVEIANAADPRLAACLARPVAGRAAAGADGRRPALVAGRTGQRSRPAQRDAGLGRDRRAGRGAPKAWACASSPAPTPDATTTWSCAPSSARRRGSRMPPPARPTRPSPPGSTTTTPCPARDGRYRVSQGREVGLDARLHLHVDADGEVWSGGHVCNVVRGTIDWP